MQDNDAIHRFPDSGTARLLAQRIIEADGADGRVRVAFEAGSAFENPAGFVQGGILATMLDDTMGPALWAHSGGTMFPVTIDMTISYLGAVRPGVIFGEGRVVQAGKTIAFLEAQLTDGDGKIVARAIASARLVKADRAEIKLRD
jgi:uncharacterized protein (TIGR00369 family)